MHLSYAQFLEDYHLDLVLGDRAEAVYVDIGGGHPVADNVSYHFYLKGWRGLVIEPQHNLAALYRLIRPRDTVLDMLVGAENGEISFHRVERLHGFSTIVKSNAEGAAAFGAGFITETRPIRRLSSLIDSHGIGDIAFLKIDVEGAEADVLAGIDWQRHRPAVLCIEAIQPGTGAPAHESWEALVMAAGYQLTLADGINRFYLANEASGLKERFPEKPAPWDCVRHYYELGPALTRPDHPDRALLARLQRDSWRSLVKWNRTPSLPSWPHRQALPAWNRQLTSERCCTGPCQCRKALTRPIPSRRSMIMPVPHLAASPPSMMAA